MEGEAGRSEKSVVEMAAINDENTVKICGREFGQEIFIEWLGI